jgi:uncharacterized protein
MNQNAMVLMLMGLVLAGCAGPPLRLYTLSDASDPADPPGSIRHIAPVIRVDRVIVPGYLDTQDILVRHGHVLERSPTGRWATRLSIAATELLSARLAMRRPDALVTDESEGGAYDYEIRVDVSELDVMSSGEAILAADWQIRRRAGAAPIRSRLRLVRHGSVATDASVVQLEAVLFDQLADAIDITSLH